MLDQLEQHIEHYPQEQPVEQPKPQEQHVESSKEQNIRIMRERAESAERRLTELERMIQMNMSQSQPSTKMQISEEDDDIDLSDDSYVEAKHLKKYVKTIKKEFKSVKQEFDEYRKQSSIDQAEFRLKAQFPDFDAIVSQENLIKLSQQDPILYRSIMANQEIFDRGYAAYKNIKSAGLANNEYAQQDKRIEDNRSKPRSAASASPQISETPLTRVGDYDRRILTEERKEQIRMQVEEAKRNKQ